MVVRTGAQLSPALAPWLHATFGVEAYAVRDLNLRSAEDAAIFAAVRAAGAAVMTKDADFITLLGLFGPPPRIIWLTCGNTSNAALRSLLDGAGPRVCTLLDAGEPLVEIGARAS